MRAMPTMTTTCLSEPPRGGKQRLTLITKTLCENILTGVAMLLEGKGEASA